MTNVSKKKLPEQELKILYEQLNEIVAKLDKKTSATFFNELLGPEERIMLAKRLAAVVMYIEDNSTYRVWQLLKLSPSTAEKIKLDYDMGRYKGIRKLLTSNKKDYEKFWETLEVVLRAGMPPMGRGRWKSVLKHF